MEVTIFPLKNFPLISSGDNLPKIITQQLQEITLFDNDIIVVAHTIVSKAESKIYDLNNINPSPFAKHIGMIQDKDPRKIEVILSDSAKAGMQVVNTGSMAIIGEE